MISLKVNGMTVDLDRSQFNFSEATLSEYLQKEGALYGFFGEQLAISEKELQRLELDHEVIYSEKYSEFKEAGGTEKLAEAKAKTSQVVIEAKAKVIEQKETVKQLQQHLRTWDKNHENAQSFGHMLRKEIDKLGSDIFSKRFFPSDVDEKLEEVLNSAR